MKIVVNALKFNRNLVDRPRICQSIRNTTSIKSACAMWKVLMVQSSDNDILEGLAVANPPQTQNPLFFSWRDLRLWPLFPSKPSIKVRCSLIDEYEKKPSAHGMSTFNGSSVKNGRSCSQNSKFKVS